MRKPKVWVIKEQTMRASAGSMVVDYSPAMEYGELNFITQTDMPLYPGSQLQRFWEEDVKRFIDEYDPKEDFIITTGQPMAIFCVGWMLATVKKTPRFLVWRREENRYRVAGFSPDFV